MTKYAVLYTDGSAFKGATGYGVHGYIGEESDKLVAGPPSQVLTQKGYRLRKEVLPTIRKTKADILKQIEKDPELNAVRDEMLAVVDKGDDEVNEFINIKPEMYVDITGTNNAGSTNNTAELDGMISAIQRCIAYEVDVGVIQSDSQYVINGLNEWIFNWMNNGWKAKNGDTISNMRLWKKLNKVREEFKGDLQISWIKAHDAHVGNEVADTLAGAGTNMAGAGYAEKIRETKGNAIPTYWKGFVVRNPLLGLRDVIMLTGAGQHTPGTYMMTDPGKDMENIGKKTNITGYGIVVMKEPEGIIEKVIDRVVSDAKGQSVPITIRLDKVYHKQTSRDLNILSDKILRQPSGQRLNYNTISKMPLVIEGYPVHLLLRGVKYVELLRTVLMAHISGKLDKTPFIHDAKVKDVTAELFQPSANGKSIMPTEVLKEATKQISLEHPRKKSKRLYALNNELPNKNRLVACGKENGKVELVSWAEDDCSPFSYAFIITTDSGHGIFCNKFTSIAL